MGFFLFGLRSGSFRIIVRWNCTLVFSLYVHFLSKKNKRNEFRLEEGGLTTKERERERPGSREFGECVETYWLDSKLVGRPSPVYTGTWRTFKGPREEGKEKSSCIRGDNFSYIRERQAVFTWTRLAWVWGEWRQRDSDPSWLRVRTPTSSEFTRKEREAEVVVFV